MLVLPPGKRGLVWEAWAPVVPHRVDDRRTLSGSVRSSKSMPMDLYSDIASSESSIEFVYIRIHLYTTPHRISNVSSHVSICYHPGYGTIYTYRAFDVNLVVWNRSPRRMAVDGGICR
jgi:hypothetical protein